VVRDLAVQYPNGVTAITYHVNGDGYDLPWGQARLDSFYGLGGAVPTLMIDGQWNCPIGDYPYCVSQQMAQSTDVTIELSGSLVSGATWDVTARVCLEGGGSRPLRVITAATLNNHPDLPSYTTHLLMQTPAESNITVPGGGCDNVTTRITFDPLSASQTSDIVVVAWAQDPSSSGPAAVHQAATMRWPFPAGSQLTTIEVSPADASLAVGGHVDFTATGKDQFGADFPLANPSWSLGASGTGDGSFDPSTGTSTTFTATAAGTRQVLCSEGGVTGAAIVTITEAPSLATIEIDPATVEVGIDGEVSFTATGKDQYGDDFPLSDPTWSVSGAGDGSFDPTTGATTVFTPTAPGSCTVTCTDGDVEGTASVQIIGDDPYLATIEVSPEAAQIRVGDDLELEATGADQYGRPFALDDPSWRVEGSGAGTLNPPTGTSTLFSATDEGDVEIICSADGVEGSAEVEIAPRGLPAPRKSGRRVTP
jgi:hypothetical protein